MSDLNDFLKKLPLDWKDPAPQRPDPLEVARSARQKLTETDLTPYYTAMDKAIQELMRKQQLPPSLQRQLWERSQTQSMTSSQYYLFPQEETYQRSPLARRLLRRARRLFLSLRSR